MALLTMYVEGERGRSAAGYVWEMPAGGATESAFRVWSDRVEPAPASTISTVPRPAGYAARFGISARSPTNQPTLRAPPSARR